MKNLKVISLGLGQQSTTLYLMSSMGQIPRADYAIFSDPGAERKATYDYLTWLQLWQKRYKGIPIIHTGSRSLYHDLIGGNNASGSRFSSIPAFTKDDQGKIGMLKRQCTEDYKIKEVNKAIRALYGLKKFAHTPQTEIWIGISTDEIERLKQPRYKWQTYVYPLCNYVTTKELTRSVHYTDRLNRLDCQKWLRQHQFPTPSKSACFFCPYQSDSSWLDMKNYRPKEWAYAVALDAKIRNSTQKGVHHPIYLHRSCESLSEVNLQENQLGLFKSECEGFCGV